MASKTAGSRESDASARCTVRGELADVRSTRTSDCLSRLSTPGLLAGDDPGLAVAEPLLSQALEVETISTRWIRRCRKR